MSVVTDNPEVMLGKLNMTDDHDRGMLRRKVGDDISKHRRWPDITPEFKADAVRALKVALRMALDGRDHRSVQGCVKTLALLEGQNQKDEHALAGLNATTVNVGVSVQNNLPVHDPQLMTEIVELRAKLAEQAVAATVAGPAITNGNGHGH